jgi:hypothetical protein
MEKDVLPRYFRSRQFSTFQRQLSYFGFKKQSTQHDKCRWCHNLFQRGKPEDVLLIKRKVNTGNEHKKRKRADCTSTSNNHPADKRTNTTSPTPMASFAATSTDRPTLSIWENPTNLTIHRLATESSEKLNPMSRMSPHRAIHGRGSSESCCRTAFSGVNTMHTPQCHYERPNKSEFSIKAEPNDQTNTLTPRTLEALQDMEFDVDSWLTVMTPVSPCMAPITPSTEALPMSWSSLAALS